MKRLLLLTLFLSFFGNLFSQGEFNNWYFGFNCGINFNTNPASATTNGLVHISDQTSTISDASGNLIMYSDGLHVYNRLHAQMPNGFDLMGSGTAYAHASIIVRKPGSANLYYIFTLTYFGYPAGFQYAIVDMNLQGGNGDVISKNNQLLTPVCEKLTAVKHSNGTDVWIITHEWNSNAFYSYLLTASGISAPVITNIGPVQTGGSQAGYNAAGQLTANCDGTRLAMGTYELGFVEVYDFDKTTGVISNQIQISGYYRSWGGQFSPDGSKLYATKWTNAEVYQFDLLAGSAANIAASSTIVGLATSPNAGYKAGFLQLGPDNKIYVAKMDALYVGVINNPNAAGTACNFVDNGLYLAGKTGQAGFPQYILTPFSIPDFTYQNSCQGDSSQFQTQNLSGFNSFFWNFGDPASGINNTSVLANPTHFYNNPGSYTVTLIANQGSISDTVQHTITIYPPVVVNLGNDTSLCSGSNMVLNAGNAGGTYLWSTGATSQSIPVSNSGTYWVSVSNGNCSDTDTVHINFQTLQVNLGNDITLCGATSQTLDAGNPGNNYIWSTGATSQTISATSSGTYWVSVSNQVCTAVDSIHIGFSAPPTVNLGSDVTLCPGNTLQLSANNPGAYYLWSTGENTSSIVVNQTGAYWVEAIIGSCFAYDSIHVNVVPQLNLGGEMSLCNHPEIILSVHGNYTSFAWSTGSSDSTIIITEPGNYWVMVSNNQCTLSDTISVVGTPSTFFIPNSFTPNDDGLNELFGPACTGIPEYHFMIFSSWGELVFETNDVHQWWDGKYKGKVVKVGVYTWKLDYKTTCDKEKMHRKLGVVVVLQ